MSVELGKPISSFIAPATSNKNIQLKSLIGQNVLLYFYPKNGTPACTIEGQDFAANYGRFLNQNTVIFGISRDSLESHEQFKDKLALPFELISDQSGQLCTLFDVLKEKQLFGKNIITVSRSSFLIDQAGILKKEWRNVNVKDHVHQVLSFIENKQMNKRSNHC